MRTPDIGIGIEVVTPRETGCDVVYYGEYLGHGHAKTAFQLHNIYEKFHGNLLKVAEQKTWNPMSFAKPAHMG